MTFDTYFNLLYNISICCMWAWTYTVRGVYPIIRPLHMDACDRERVAGCTSPVANLRVQAEVGGDWPMPKIEEPVFIAVWLSFVYIHAYIKIYPIYRGFTFKYLVSIT